MRIVDIIKKPIYILKGVNTYLPENLFGFLPSHQIQAKGRGIRQSQSIEDLALACYGLWLRFLVRTVKLNKEKTFSVVGEIGPGDSFGVGICALLSGANTYYAFDMVPTSFNVDNLELVDKIRELFIARKNIPNDLELPKAIPKLESYEFPSHILTDDLLTKSLSDERVEKIKKELINLQKNEDVEASKEIKIRYYAPYDETSDNFVEEIDLIFSAACFEHVANIEKAYRFIYKSLKSGAIMCHAIDLKSHGTSSLWNGHLTYSDLTWNLIKGRSVYLINRKTFPEHIKCIKMVGFKVLLEDVYTKPNQLTNKDLARNYKSLTDKEVSISEFFVVAKK